MIAILSDLRYAVRGTGSRPGFAAAVILTLALGIGATTAIFSVLHAVILNPLPYPEPDQLVSVWESVPERGVTRNVVNSGNFLDWRDENEVFTSIAAYSHLQTLSLTGSGRPERVSAVAATPTLFQTLGVFPAIGEPPRERGEVVISYAFWQSRFGGNADAIGTTVMLDGGAAKVTGVMPPGFAFPARGVQLWRTLVLDESARELRRGRQWKVVARLRPGVAAGQAQGRMRAVADGIRARHPADMQGWSVNVFPLHADVVGGYSAQVTAEGGIAGTLWVVMGVVAMTLLIACVNVAGLMLARLARRRRELAIRKALGADRRRLVATVFTECAMYTAVGAALGVAVAYGSLAALVSTVPVEIPRLAEAAISVPVLAFSAVLACVVVGLVGLLPALEAGRADAAGALAAGGREGSSSGLHVRRTLIAAEVAIACVLTAGALLLTHNLIRVLGIDPGHAVGGIQMIEIPLSSRRYEGTAQQLEFHEQVMQRLRAEPGVLAVSGTAEPPLVGHQMTFSYFVEGAAADFDDSQPVRVVHDDYFRVMGHPLRAGRGFTPADSADSAPVAVVNEAFARRNWPEGDALGRRIRVDDADGAWVEIVGMAADTRHEGLMQEPAPAIYLPFAQKPWWWMAWTSYLVQVAPGVTLPADAVRAAVWAVDSEVAVGRVASLESIYAESTARARLAALMLVAFAMLALVLGVIGIYSVVAFSVTQRRREFSLRMAIGATGGAILRQVLRDGLKMVGAGLVAGLALSIGFAFLLRSQLYLVAPLDAVTFSLTPALILVAAVLACLVPGQRAAAIRPMESLRHE